MTPGIDADFFAMYLQLLGQAVLFSVCQLSANSCMVSMSKPLGSPHEHIRGKKGWEGEERVDLRHNIFCEWESSRRPSGAPRGPTKVLVVPSWAPLKTNWCLSSLDRIIFTEQNLASETAYENRFLKQATMAVFRLPLLSGYPNMCLKLLFHSLGIGQIVHCRLDT